MKRTSIFLSLLLRHKPETVGLTLDPHGWADVKTLIEAVNRTGKYELDMQKLEAIVRTDEKQRYSFNEDKTKIRANQGHSIAVDVELKECQPPELLYHGTGVKSMASIAREGLQPRSRLYVHLSQDIETAVKVGQRHGIPHVYAVMAGEMYRKGHSFYLSANGVWLVKHVPAEFLTEPHTV